MHAGPGPRCNGTVSAFPGAASSFYSAAEACLPRCAKVPQNREIGLVTKLHFVMSLQAKLYFAPHAGCAGSGDNSGLREIEFRAHGRSQVQLLSLPTSFSSGYGIEMPTYVFRIPTRFHIIAQWLRYSATLGKRCLSFAPFYSNGVTSVFPYGICTTVTQPRWGKRELGALSNPG